MAIVWLIQIFATFTLYVEVVKGDCTSCPPVSLTCDPHPEQFNSVNGIFSQSFTTDENGCKVVTLSCKDDSGFGGTSIIHDEVRILFQEFHCLIIYSEIPTLRWRYSEMSRNWNLV